MEVISIKHQFLEIKNIIRQMILYIVMIIFIQAIVDIVKEVINSLLTKFFEYNLFISLVADVFSLIVGFLIIQYLLKKNKTEVIWKKFPDVRKSMLIIGIFISYIMIYQNTLARLLEMLALPSPLLKYIGEIDEKAAIALVISMVFSGPILEELLVRGIVLKNMLKKFTALQSIVFSSIIFAVLHFDIEQGINAFFIGALLGYFYYKTDSIMICISLHILNNGYAILKAVIIQNFNLSQKIMGNLELITGSILIILIVILHKKIFNDKRIHINDLIR